MARTRSKPPTFEPTAVSHALKMRRVELGKSQGDVAFDSGSLTQTTVSELERGKYGPEDLTSARLAALAKGLNWTIGEMQDAIGIQLFQGISWTAIANTTPADHPSHKMTLEERFAAYPPSDPNVPPARAFSAAAMGYRVPKQEPTPISDALLEAAEQFGADPEFAGLREYRWQRYLNDIPFRARPVTPGEWLRVYVNRKAEVDPPEPQE